MSINGVFRTSVSGMNAQSNKLSAVSDNIANSATTGYKRADVEFSSLVINSGGRGNYTSGSVLSQTRYDISTQGLVTTTSSKTDLAISGDGFFVVEDQNGQPFFTRAGSFVQRTEPDTGETFLVNAAGYKLTGQNGPVQVPVGEIVAPQATTTSELSMQLPLNGTGTHTGSFTAFNSRGEAVNVSMTATRTGADQWDLTFDAPSASAPVTVSVTFDAATGLPNPPITTAGNLQIVPPANGGGGAPSTVALNLGQLTSYDAAFTFQAEANGNPATGFSDFTISDDGRVFGILTTGRQIELDRIQLARFQSPDQLDVISGNVFRPSQLSGDPQFGFSGELGFGDLISGALEESNVDLASELTDMIVTQRSYAANSKTFQTGSEMLDLLVNLKR
ncbi:flagellar hook protein E [Fulvimarina pelagi HTCC2506]|uniref:Flagellar hook protein FlgE n=2 Tax=Fulvimarina pelagi TaxID=217511 RepID=Q0G073_9HYPH|nr:flagellar hook protein FlgE [Fulvimarina pelagi]EAU40720.1 flagellar hook protein E [Fulvimarina pelagi HTCC2506]BAT31262.1 flagellar hook protein E [Fulvimarina pelagi]